jgi:hypothetical protein
MLQVLAIVSFAASWFLDQTATGRAGPEPFFWEMTAWSLS